MRIIKYGLILALSGVMSGCAVKLISDYDEVTDKSITEIHSKINTYVISPTTAKPEITETGKAFYVGLRQKIAELEFRARAIPKNSITVKQIQVLSQQVDLFEQADKNGYSVEEIALFLSYFDQTCGAILKLELAKKRE